MATVLVYNQATKNYRLTKMPDGVNMLSNVAFTVNNVGADETDNIFLTPAQVGAAEATHVHVIADVNNLAETLATKALANHTHEVVNRIVFDGTELSGDITIDAGLGIGMVTDQATGKITISGAPYTHDAASQLVPINDDTKAVTLFVGTQAEWNAFTPQSGVTYLVMLRA
jgi:hypothetical protein